MAQPYSFPYESLEVVLGQADVVLAPLELEDVDGDQTDLEFQRVRSGPFHRLPFDDLPSQRDTPLTLCVTGESLGTL